MPERITEHIDLRLTVFEAMTVHNFLLAEPLNNPDMFGSYNGREMEAFRRFVNKVDAAIEEAKTKPRRLRSPAKSPNAGNK